MTGTCTVIAANAGTAGAFDPPPSADRSFHSACGMYLYFFRVFIILSISLTMQLELTKMPLMKYGWNKNKNKSLYI